MRVKVKCGSLTKINKYKNANKVYYVKTSDWKISVKFFIS